MEVRAGSATDVGLWRATNEDALLVGSRLFVVADGMGGHAAGEVASRLSVEQMARADLPGVTLADLRDAVHRACVAVCEHAVRHPESAGMGSTLTGVALGEVEGVPSWLVVHLGDSRAYVFQEGRLRQVTRDHSEVQELVEAGILTPAEARSHPLSNIITRAVGEWPAPQPDVVTVPVEPGQRVLLASDGLTNELEDAQIAALLAEPTTPEVAAARLVEAALAAGGRDNVTVVVLDVEPGRDEGEPPGDA